MDDLYRELIIDHYKNPQYRGHLDTHQITFEDDNPLCGDHIHVEMQVNEDGVVTNAAFEGHGCAISQASADPDRESGSGNIGRARGQSTTEGPPGARATRRRV